MKYRALYITEENRVFHRKIAERDTTELPDNDVLIKVTHSSLNFKDALSASGNKGITKNYPFQPGIDAAGEVVEDKSGNFAKGDKVIVTGYDLGMNTDGGFGEFIKVPHDWIINLPCELTLEESMYYGTAGFTAAICIYEIIQSGISKGSEVLVTGASGGVGICAVGLLRNAGYKPIASSGKSDSHDMLFDLGAERVISREEAYEDSGKALLKGKWDSVIDNVGGQGLSTLLRSTKQHGIICSLGNVAGVEFSTNLFPFLLRGVSIIGIDSASKSLELRLILWSLICNQWKINNLHKYIKKVNLEGLSAEIDLILQGSQKGRVVLEH